MFVTYTPRVHRNKFIWTLEGTTSRAAHWDDLFGHMGITLDLRNISFCNYRKKNWILLEAKWKTLFSCGTRDDHHCSRNLF